MLLIVKDSGKTTLQCIGNMNTVKTGRAIKGIEKAWFETGKLLEAQCSLFWIKTSKGVAAQGTQNIAWFISNILPMFWLLTTGKPQQRTQRRGK